MHVAACDSLVSVWLRDRKFMHILRIELVYSRMYTIFNVNSARLLCCRL